MRILMVEDEKYLALATRESLKKANYIVDLAYDGEEGLDRASSGIYDLLIFDIMLPTRSGLDILETIRAEGISTPVLLLTAKGEVEDRVKGLDLGADDYLAKPFHVEELLARLRALSRRPEVVQIEGLTFGDLTLNQADLTLYSGQQEVTLTLKESQILGLLIQNGKRILSKEWIIEKVWGWDSDATDNHVESHISLIRKKLTRVASHVRVKAIRGAGYILEDGGNAQ